MWNKGLQNVLALKPGQVQTFRQHFYKDTVYYKKSTVGQQETGQNKAGAVEHALMVARLPPGGQALVIKPEKTHDKSCKPCNQPITLYAVIGPFQPRF